MRIVSLAMVLVMCSGVAFAGETLTVKDDPYPFTARTGQLYVYRLSKAPDGVTGPGGEELWLKLKTGERTRYICIVKEGGEYTDLYFDRDDTKDFTKLESMGVSEPRPYEKSPYVYDLGRIPCRFEIDGSVLEADFRMRIRLILPSMFFPKLRVNLETYTQYAGKMNVEGRELDVRWLPGGGPKLWIRGRTFSCATAHVGRQVLDLKGMRARASGGVVTLDYSYTEDKALKAVEVPKDLTVATVFFNEDGDRKKRKIIACIPKDGKIYVKSGILIEPFYTMVDRKNKDGSWRLTTVWRNFDVDSGAKAGGNDPLQMNLSARMKKLDVYVTPSFKDFFEQKAVLQKYDNGVYDSPTYEVKIKDAEGNVLAESETDGTFVWSVPKKYVGKTLVAEARLKSNVPFLVHSSARETFRPADGLKPKPKPRFRIVPKNPGPEPEPGREPKQKPKSGPKPKHELKPRPKPEKDKKVWR